MYKRSLGLKQWRPCPPHVVGAVFLTLLLTGCSSLEQRKQANSNAYHALDPAMQAMVDQGRIDVGMDTNAVYIALGRPSEVVENSLPQGQQTIWAYYTREPVHVPGWRYVPNGRGNWSVEYQPLHYSQTHVKAEAVFLNGRVVEFRQF